MLVKYHLTLYFLTYHDILKIGKGVAANKSGSPPL